MQGKPLYCQSMIMKLLFIHTLVINDIFIALDSVFQQVCFVRLDLRPSLERLVSSLHVRDSVLHEQPRVTV